MASEADKKPKESFEDKLADLAGLPPGRFPDGTPKPSDTSAPRKTLTSDDAEGLPTPSGTGTQPRN